MIHADGKELHNEEQSGPVKFSSPSRKTYVGTASPRILPGNFSPSTAGDLTMGKVFYLNLKLQPMNEAELN